MHTYTGILSRCVNWFRIEGPEALRLFSECSGALLSGTVAPRGRDLSFMFRFIEGGILIMTGCEIR